MKFVKIASANETKEVSSHSESLPQVETEKEVYHQQNNIEVIRPIERSEPMNETLSSKDKTDHNCYFRNDVATWPEILTHNMSLTILKQIKFGYLV